MDYYPTPQPSPQKPRPHRTWGPESAPKPILRQKPTAEIISPSDLAVVRSLGSGAWGRVVMVQVANSSSLVAVKALPKKELHLTNEASQHKINTEKRNLSRLPWSPFLAGAVTALSDATNLSLVLELMPHGSFQQLMDQFGPLSQMDACFYYCNVVCAIEFIHSHGLVSRDIKPANFLVGHDGYLVMTDLGTAEKVGEGGSWLNMGTAQYMAPESIQQDYTIGRAIDWWASGVMLYEMLTQETPFQGDKDHSIFHNILMLNYKWPQEPVWGNSLKHIISRLLTFDPPDRLGYSGTSQVMDHPWLSHVDWIWMRHRVYEAPWVPAAGTELINKWHSQEMPASGSMGSAKVRHPPRYLHHDRRYSGGKFIVEIQSSGLGSEDLHTQ